MHPTADTNIVIFHQRCGAAGDAGRYASATGSGELVGRLRAVECGATWGYLRGADVALFLRRPLMLYQQARAAAMYALRHNNGMQRSADTKAFMFSQSGFAPADAGRSAALWRNRNSQMFAGRILTAENSCG
jgi:hypothetical protein